MLFKADTRPEARVVVTADFTHVVTLQRSTELVGDRVGIERCPSFEDQIQYRPSAAVLVRDAERHRILAAATGIHKRGVRHALGPLVEQSPRHRDCGHGLLGDIPLKVATKTRAIFGIGRSVVLSRRSRRQSLRITCLKLGRNQAAMSRPPRLEPRKVGHSAARAGDSNPRFCECASVSRTASDLNGCLVTPGVTNVAGPRAEQEIFQRSLLVETILDRPVVRVEVSPQHDPGHRPGQCPPWEDTRDLIAFSSAYPARSRR